MVCSFPGEGPRSNNPIRARQPAGGVEQQLILRKTQDSAGVDMRRQCLRLAKAGVQSRNQNCPRCFAPKDTEIISLAATSSSANFIRGLSLVNRTPDRSGLSFYIPRGRALLYRCCPETGGREHEILAQYLSFDRCSCADRRHRSGLKVRKTTENRANHIQASVAKDGVQRVEIVGGSYFFTLTDHRQSQYSGGIEDSQRAGDGPAQYCYRCA